MATDTSDRLKALARIANPLCLVCGHGLGDWHESPGMGVTGIVACNMSGCHCWTPTRGAYPPGSLDWLDGLYD